MVHPQRSRVLVDLVLAEDVADTWERTPLDRRRAVVSTLVEVTLLRGRAGRTPFDPNTVQLVPAAGME